MAKPILRGAGGRFLSGTGTPKSTGRPKGSRNKATLLLEQLLAGEASAILRACIKSAKGGDTAAMRILVERILPPVRERGVEIDIGDIGSTAGVDQAQRRIVEELAAGGLYPSEAIALSDLIEGQRLALLANAMDARLAALEGGK